MNPADESPFRLAFGLFWALNMVVRIYFQVKARNSDVSLRRNEQRTKLFFRLLLAAFLFMLVYICSTWFDFAHIPLHASVRWFLGGGILIVYLALFFWVHHTLGRNWSGLLEIHKDHELVINGPYRYVRHPMYSAFFLSGIGIFFLSANWLVGLVYLVAVALMYFERVSREEEMMIERFGDSYRAYMKTTGRLLPRLPGW